MSRLLLLYDLTNAVTSSWSPITDCVHPTTALFLAGQSRIVHIYWRIYARAGTEERKTRSWPLRAVRLLNPMLGVSPAANPRFLPTTGPPELAASFSVAPPGPDRVPHCRCTGSRNRWWWDPRRGAPPAPLRVVVVVVVAGNLTADRKARLPLRSSAKIATKAPGRASFSSSASSRRFPAFHASTVRRCDRNAIRVRENENYKRGIA